MNTPLKKRGLTPQQRVLYLALVVGLVVIAVILVPMALLRVRDMLR